MKIKIPPYPNYKISDQALKGDVITNSVKKADSSGLSNQLIIISKYKTGEKRVIKSRPVRYNNNLYITSFPNPIHLFLSLAIEHYNLSESIKKDNFPKCGKKYGDDIFILDFEENGTHDCYNLYVKYRISSIIMLVSSIESYLNHIIPNDFIYKTKRKNREVEFSKIDIESPKISFREKLIDILPQLPLKRKTRFSWDNLKDEKSIILDLYENRKNLIHLKTDAQDGFSMYFNTIDKMFDYDIQLAINSIINVMNLVTPKFIEVEKNASNNT